MYRFSVIDCAPVIESIEYSLETDNLLGTAFSMLMATHYYVIHNIYGFVDQNAYFVYIDTPEGYEKLGKDLKSNLKYYLF